MKPLRFAVEDVALRATLALAGVLPRRPLLAAGRFLGQLAWLAHGSRRRLTLAQLERALGDEIGPRELRRVGRESWRNVGANLMDSLWCSRRDFVPADELVRISGREHLDAAYARGRGVLQFTGHFGHWELAAAAQARRGVPLALVARRMDNPALERQMRRLREVAGNRIVHKDGAARELLRTLARGGGVAIVIDQDARDDGVFVPFFGRPASTTPALARLALRTGAAVLPTFCIAEGRGYRLSYEAPLEPRRTGDVEADALELTARCTATLERWVRAHPEQWWWMHRRWKSTPQASVEPQS